MSGFARFFAEVAKLADALDLGSSVERRASSSLALGTKFSNKRPVVSYQ